MAIRETVHRPIPHVERPIADPPRPQRAGRRRRVAEDYNLMGVALLAGAANVIMELSRPGVGHGVAESRVESGRCRKTRRPWWARLGTSAIAAGAERGHADANPAPSKTSSQENALTSSRPTPRREDAYVRTPACRSRRMS